MVIHTAGPRSLALFFEQGELNHDEEMAGQDKLESVVKIARATFTRQGIEAKYFEIEEYAGVSGTVIFVLAGENAGRLLFSFSSASEAANAARALRGEPIDARLIRLDGRYYLRLLETADRLEKTQWTLSEFGRQENPDELFCAHIEEHGQTVIKKHAVSGLRRYW